MENVDKKELARQLAKMKKELRQKERKLKKYNKALEAKKHVQETIKRQNTHLTSHISGEVTSGEPSGSSSERGTKNGTSRNVTFSEKDPEVIYTSPVGVEAGKKNPKALRKGKEMSPDGAQEMQQDSDFRKTHVLSDNSGILGKIDVYKDHRASPSKEIKEANTLMEDNHEDRIDCIIPSVTVGLQKEECVSNANLVFVENNSLQNLSITDEKHVSSTSSTVPAQSNCYDVPFSAQDAEISQNELKGRPTKTHEVLDADNVEYREDAKIVKYKDETVKTISAKSDVFKLAIESQDLFETPFNNNIDIKRRCKSSTKSSLRRLTEESMSGELESSKEESAEDIKAISHTSAIICETRTFENKSSCEESPSTHIRTVSTVSQVPMPMEMSMAGENISLDDKEKKNIATNDIGEMFETSREMEELEEEMMDAVRSAEEIMSVEERCPETCYQQITTPDTSMIESQGKYRDPDQEVLQSSHCMGEDINAPEDSGQPLQLNETSSCDKLITPVQLSSEKFGKVFSAITTTITEKNNKLVQVLLVHKCGFTLWGMVTDGSVRNNNTKTSDCDTDTQSWKLVEEFDFEVGSDSELRFVLGVGLPSEEEARFIIFLERFTEKDLTLVYVQSSPTKIIESSSIPHLHKAYEEVLCCYVSEWSIATYWKPEEPSNRGSLLITDFDIAYSRRCKKWTLQCNFSAPCTLWEEHLTSLTPISNTGSEGILLCTTSNSLYIYDALHEVILTQHPWHLAHVSWAVGLKELLFIMRVQEKEALLSAVNPLSGESELFEKWLIDETSLRQEKVQVDQKRMKVSGISSSSEGLVIVWTDGTVACIPLKNM